MRAAVQTRYGGPAVVSIQEVDKPVPAAGELLVRVRAATVNRTDCGYRAAHPFFIRAFSGLTKPKAAVLGTEYSGDVVSIGAGVATFSVGDRVFGYCEGTFGAHAEYVTVPADGLVATIPDGWGYSEVAPALEGWHYALADIRAAGIGAGDRVLVNGATGAIGSAAVQIAKSLGAEVTAVCGPAHVDLVAGLGADRVIDNSVDDFTADDTIYDLVFDAVGKSTFGRCRHLLRPGGIFATSDLGPGWQNPFLVFVTRFGQGKRVIIVPPDDDPQQIVQVKEMLEAATFRPVIDCTYPLEQIVDAYTYVESGQKIGNVVIDVALDAPS